MSEEKKEQKVMESKAKASVPKPPVNPEDEAVKQMGRHWNAIVNAMQTAEKAWNAILEEHTKVSRERLMLAPLEVQRALSRFGKAQFNVMLSRFVDYYRAQGGLEAMKIKEVK